MSRSLFDIGTDFHVLNDLANETIFDDETGEILNQDEEIEQIFNDIASELNDKLDNTTYIVKELLADADTIKKERERLYKKQVALTNKATLLKSLMLGALKASDMKKVKTLAHTFSLRKSKAVSITDEDKIARNYLRIKYEVDRTKIKEAIKNGESVDGAEMVENESITIK